MRGEAEIYYGLHGNMAEINKYTKLNLRHRLINICLCVLKLKVSTCPSNNVLAERKFM